MSMSFHQYSPSTIILFGKVMGVLLLAFAIHNKYFADELISEVLQNAKVIDVSLPTGDGSVASSQARVQVQLDDGARANALMDLNPPAVGELVKVMVRTYESGDRKISVRQY